MCVSNPWNDDFGYLLFDGNKRLITRQLIYVIHDNIVEKFNNGSTVDIYMNQV